MTRDTALEATMRRLFDAGTFARGRAYADGGAVLGYLWVDPGVRLQGNVRGSGRSSYVTHVAITRSESGAIVDVKGRCTCPMVVDCKHVVALVLTAEPGWAPWRGGDLGPGQGDTHAPVGADATPGDPGRPGRR